MVNYNMLSGNFADGIIAKTRKTKNIIWNIGKEYDVSFYLDGDISKGFRDRYDGKTKFLWTLESPYFNKGVFLRIRANLRKTLDTYDLIFTYNEKLLALSEKFKFAPAGDVWIDYPQVYEKTKLISMIVSNKVYTPQQIYRYVFSKLNQNKIDIYGRGVNPISKKEFGLTPYMFSICVENATYNTYYTEKILDCFATGTIPIYLGTRNISKHFDQNGILFLDEIKLKDLTPELYFSKMDSILTNLEKVKEYKYTEDYIFEKYLMPRKWN